MKEEKNFLRQRFKNAIAFLQRGWLLARKLFFSDKESAVREPLKTESLGTEIKNEDTKAARRFKDRVNKFYAAQRDLKKAEDRYNAQLIKKSKDTNISPNTASKHDAEITKLYCKVEEARKKVEIAEKKLIRDKIRYEEEI